MGSTRIYVSTFGGVGLRGVNGAREGSCPFTGIAEVLEEAAGVAY